MPYPNFILSCLFVLLIGPASILARPPHREFLTENNPLIKRLNDNDGRDPSNAIDVVIDCTNQPDNCEQNCYAIHCKGVTRILQYDAANAQEKRRLSGAAWGPFKDGHARKLGNIERPGYLYRSAEEYPYASTEQGGMGAILFPALNPQQHVQGGKIGVALDNAGVDDGDWFNIKDFSSAPGPYCTALRSNPPDYSVCTRRLADGVEDWGRYAYERISLPNQPYQFKFVGKGNPFGLKD